MSAAECHSSRDTFLIGNQVFDPEVHIGESHAKQNDMLFQGFWPWKHMSGGYMVHEGHRYPRIHKRKVALVKDLLKCSLHDDLVCFY